MPVVCRKTNGEVNISHENTTMVVTRNDDEISTSPRNIGIYIYMYICIYIYIYICIYISNENTTMVVRIYNGI